MMKAEKSRIFWKRQSGCWSKSRTLSITPGGGDNDDNDWFSEITEAWIEEGIVPVFAAGNQSSGDPAPGSIANPGNLLEVLSVGAVDRNKNLGKFSLVGPSAFDETGKIIKPEIVAPGVQVRSVDATGHYVSWNGTSMATPHVTSETGCSGTFCPGNQKCDHGDRRAADRSEISGNTQYGVWIWSDQCI